MDLERKIKYNKRQSSEYGWTPQDFGEASFDKNLIRAIVRFQEEFDLDADGLCGPATYRRLKLHQDEDSEEEPIDYDSGGMSSIMFGGSRVSIFWGKVTLWNEPGGLGSKRGAYRDSKGRTPRYFVYHWDVSRSSKQTASILSRRGLSVHFLLDADSRIFQCMDLEKIGYHAKNHNRNSAGVEICNPYYPKYSRYDEKRGLGKRPIASGLFIHGKPMKDFLDFFPAQISALIALTEAVSFACNIPLNRPDTFNAVDRVASSGGHRGFCNHYHLTRRKIDAASLDMQYIMEEARKLRLRRNL